MRRRRAVLPPPHMHGVVLIGLRSGRAPDEVQHVRGSGGVRKACRHASESLRAAVLAETDWRACGV